MCSAQPGAAWGASLEHSPKCWCAAPELISGEPGLSISPFKPSFKPFPWALVTQQSVPLLPGQAGWVTASASTPFHEKLPQNLLHLFSCTCLRNSTSWVSLIHGLATVALVLPKSHQLLWHVLGFSARSLCFPEIPQLRDSLECSSADRAATGAASLGNWVFICFFHFSPFICLFCCQNTNLPILSITTSTRVSLMKNVSIKIICIFSPVHPIAQFCGAVINNFFKVNNGNIVFKIIGMPLFTLMTSS